MEQQEVIIPSTQKPKSNFLIIAVLLVGILLSISLIYFGLQLSLSQKQKVVPPTPIPVEVNPNMKTYKNNQYNFEFKYPSKFITTSAFAENIVLALQNNANTSQRLSTLPDIYLRVLEIPQDQTFESVMNKNVVSDGMGWDENSINKITTKQIGENLVYYVQTGVFEGILTTNYFIITNNNIYAFVVNSNPVDWTNPNYKIEDDQLNKDFLEILSTFKFLDLKPEETPAPLLKNIPILETTDWKIVHQNGVSFKVPKDARCNSSVSPEKSDDENCHYLYLVKDQIVPTLISVSEYKGGSRRDQFLGANYTDCHYIFEEAMFGNIKALQIANDGGWCQGGGGGIVTVIGNKFVVFYELGYTYNTKEILRWNFRDTIVSTLKLD